MGGNRFVPELRSNAVPVVFMASPGPSTVELLPTGLRATGHSFAKLTGNLGGIIAPYIVESSLSMVVVSAIFAAVGLMCATVVTFLPETMGQALGEVVVHDGINQSSSTGETSDSLEKC